MESYIHIHLLRLRVVLQKSCQIRIGVDAVLRFKTNQIDGRSLTVAHNHIDVIPIRIRNGVVSRMVQRVVARIPDGVGVGILGAS